MAISKRLNARRSVCDVMKLPVFWLGVVRKNVKLRALSAQEFQQAGYVFAADFSNLAAFLGELLELHGGSSGHNKFLDVDLFLPAHGGAEVQAEDVCHMNNVEKDVREFLRLARWLGGAVPHHFLTRPNGTS